MIYFVLGLAYLPRGPIRSFNRLGDYSYGLYIYAFPVQQSLVARFPELTPGPLFLAAFAVTLVLAILSWHLIENPALGIKRRILSKQGKIA